MSVISSPISFLDMPRKEQAPRTDQINFRLRVATIERMEAYRDNHVLHPTLTSIVEAAVNEWLDRNAPPVPAKPKPRR